MEIFFKIGIILLIAIPLGHLFLKLKLPKILGYMAGGIILGPYVIKILDHNFLKSLESFNVFALSYLIFLVGTKIKIENLKGNIKIILVSFGLQMLFTVISFTLIFFFFFKNILLSFFLGIIALTIAPASTIAVIDELDAEGTVTGNIITLVALNNIIIILLFSLLAPPIILKNVPNILNHIYFSFLKFAGSIILGIVAGFILSYLEARAESSLTLTFSAIGMVLFLFGILEYFKISPYVGALFLGFVVTNASIKHKKVLKELEFFDHLIYILFFFIAGASMHLDILIKMLPWVLLYIVLRGSGEFFGAYLGSIKAGFEKEEAKAFGLGILTQAGLATGFALILGTYGNEGKFIMNLILGSIVVSETIGVILLKRALINIGEVKLFRVIEEESEPIFDFQFQTIIKEFMKQLGFKQKRKTEKEILAKDLMKRNFSKVNIADDLSEIIKVFEKAKCGTIPVVDDKNEFKGAIRIEILEEIVYNKTLEKLILADDILEKDIPVIAPDDNIEKISEFFREYDFDALPVCKNNKLLGMIIRREILRYV